MSLGAPARSPGFWRPHHPPSTRKQSSTPGQERAAHSRPADARPGSDRGLAPNAWFSLLVCVSGEQPHVKRENTPPSKTRLFSRRQKGWAANSLPPLATLGRRHGARQACASFRPPRAQPHLPPRPDVFSGLCAGARGRAGRGPGGLTALAPSPSTRRSVVEPSRPLP